MSNLNIIDELLKDENLPEVEAATPHSKIELTPSPEILAQSQSTQTSEQPTEPKTNENPSELREFTRIDVREKQLELKFSNDLQFAKQYIENISLGGLFVKTTQKHELGAIIPIEFSIPSKGSENNSKAFNLKGKVCRVTPEGVGLEFTNLSLEARQELEDFVRSILPKGAAIQNKVRAASVDRLEKSREQKAKADEKLRRLAISSITIGLLILLNYFMYRNLQITSEMTDVHARVDKIHLGDQDVDRSEIRSIERNSEGLFMVYLKNGKKLQVPRTQLEDRLPYDLRVDLHVLTTARRSPPPRTPKLSRVIRQKR